MRILLVAAANKLTGGGERHVADLADALIGTGHDVAIVAPPGGDFDDIALERGATRFKADIGSGFSFTKVRAVSDAIEMFQPDIVHAHGHRAGFFARLADRKGAERVIVTLHGIHVNRGRLAPVKKLIERVLEHRTAHTITTCEADADLAFQLGIARPETTTVIYNGVRKPKKVEKGQFRQELGISDDHFLILHVGRLSPPKDHPTLVNGFAQYCDHTGDTSVQLAMICPGEDDDRNHLRYEIIAPLPCSEQIHVKKGRADLSTAYTDADMFLLTSLWEARPYVLVEAMSYKCAVITTDVGGICELVTDGETGLLIEPGNPAAVAAAIQRLIDDPGLRYKLGVAGYESVKGRFTIGEMAEKIVEVYRKVSDAA